MSNSSNDPSYQHFDSDTPGVECVPAVPGSLGSQSDPFSIEEIDAQIRWFFESVLDSRSSNP
jgi:hypothetical protein